MAAITTRIGNPLRSRKQLSIVIGIICLSMLLAGNSDALQNRLTTSHVGTQGPSIIDKNRQDPSRCEQDGVIETPESNISMSRSSFFVASAAAIMALPAAATGSSASFDVTTPPEPSPFGDISNSVVSSNVPVSSGLSTSQQESISGFVAGASLSTVKTLVKFPLDTATVRLQIPNSGYTLRDLPRLFSGSYSGVTLSLLSNIPGGAIFFAVKDATKASLKASALSAAAPRWVTTSIAVATALVPYWAIRNPSEVVKVRQQVGIDGYGEGTSPLDALKTTINESNGTALEVAEEFYTGYWENIIYGLPADVIKFVAYEAITDGRKDLAPVEGAAAGAVATAVAQLLTTPLDVVRNRLMTGKDGSVPAEEKPRGYIQSLIRLAREEGAEGFFAGASPRVAKAFLSGAIQFATYEETKQSIARILQK